MNTAEIVQLLREASDAYYNGGTLKMDDDTYDSLVERLKQLDPENEFFNEIGAPTEGAVKLPYPMPSLDKIKPGQDTLKRFLSNSDFVISEKLDGLSALWNGKLYLRGDGIMGQDISHLHGIQGLKRVAEPVRGEIILTRSEDIPLRRSWVNGQVHQKTPLAENLQKIHFVAYEVMNTRMTRTQQFEWLKSKGFEIPWTISVKAITEAELCDKLVERRNVSIYDTDGLVIGLDKAPVSESTIIKAKNPKDCVAFKMPLADQSAETTLVNVLWAPSAQGYLIPRLQFEPVVIGSATIEYCTGHNARTILQNKLGPGARIVIRRSGDVIPKLDSVLTATEASFPPEGTWAWDGVNIKALGVSVEMISAKLHYFLKTLEIPGAGPATATALVEAGIVGPATLWAASPETLSKILGPKTGAALYANLRNLKLTELALMHASSTLPRGVGTTKLTSLFTVEPDPRKWPGITPPEGWTTESFQNFLAMLPTYVEWRKSVPYPYPILGITPVNTPTKAIVCITGFRDKAIEERAAAKGYPITSTFTSKVSLLLVPDGEVTESEKVKTAKAKGIKIVSRSEFVSQYLSW
jgi:DNA ligase (NAD+)